MSNLPKINPFYENIIDTYLNKGFCIIDNWLTYPETAVLRNELEDLYQENLFKKSAIGNRLNENLERSIRSDFIFWLDETRFAQTFFSKINSFIEYINKTCFAGIVTKEFHYAIYPQGSFYKKHIDTFQNDDRRTISIVCYLNEIWQPSFGGQLKLYLDDKDLEIFPTNGKIVLFNSKAIEHEVLPVLTENKRLSITGWLKTN
ncbi:MULTISPECIES: 2OG-Fe(II) oxygenase [unclassified Francisella]|uniref:2OG-Fe(II) oxygenase n=1 Tax=unclassified Francisella TaxID=2610885 RepID=UPI002E33716D|nr:MULTISPECIES: 2OG-Fe(II) oxygenase [unclassified Francisella]MED7818529.1 2OG-Fe(II) oxygenase [Francisella sp. 19S2-4]MED7829365.1 2OG-Fe(II) oxygenase [Francisella sp. 19S2-10]